MSNLVDIKDNPVVTELIELVKKYAQKACHCDLMMGYGCEIHTEVRDDLDKIKELMENPLEDIPDHELESREGGLNGS